MSRRVIVTGGRDFQNVPMLWRALDGLHKADAVAYLAEGASDDVTGPYIGADYWARQWAEANDVPHISHHADWDAYGKAAGPIRNQHMRDLVKPTEVVAFPGGRGTASMVNLAEEVGIPVRYFPEKPRVHVLGRRP